MEERHENILKMGRKSHFFKFLSRAPPKKEYTLKVFMCERFFWKNTSTGKPDSEKNLGIFLTFNSVDGIEGLETIERREISRHRADLNWFYRC